VLRWRAQQRSSGCDGARERDGGARERDGSEHGRKTTAHGSEHGAAAVVEKARWRWRTRRVSDSGEGSVDGGGGLKN
jgi:hypothetical protein